MVSASRVVPPLGDGLLSQGVEGIVGVKHAITGAATLPSQKFPIIIDKN
jgi:hypothetical protein